MIAKERRNILVAVALVALLLAIRWSYGYFSSSEKTPEAATAIVVADNAPADSIASDTTPVPASDVSGKDATRPKSEPRPRPRPVNRDFLGERLERHR